MNLKIIINYIMKFKTNTVNETEMVYSLLREKYPGREILIEYNDNTKEYNLELTDKTFKEDPEVPLDINISCIYGDSYTGDSPVLLQKDGLVYIKTVQDLFDIKNKIEYPGFKMFDKTIRLEKEYCLSDFKVWCDQGWTNIKKIIRHKTNKKIYRVLTHTGCIDVSEDHSLLNSKLEKVKPEELNIGESLSHSFPNNFPEIENTIVKMKKIIENSKICNECNISKDINDFYKSKGGKDGYQTKCKECRYYKKSKHTLQNIMKDFNFKDYILTEKEAEVWGMFCGDGSAGRYVCKSGIKHSWALNNQDLDRLHYFKDILELIEPIKFEILDTLKSSGVYKLVPKGSIKYMVEKYRPLFYDTIDANTEGDKYKIVPHLILNASKEIKKSFFYGYYEADGSKTGGRSSIKRPEFSIKGKIGAQGMYYLMRSIGFDMCLNLYNHSKKQEMYRLAYTDFRVKKYNEIKKIVEKTSITVNDYIYDIETECGRLVCGVGQLQIANTDSVFLSMKFNRDDFEKNRKDTFKLASICGETITNDVFKRPPINLEFEKVFQPFILLTKKRYIGNKYEDVKDPMKLKTVTQAGLATSRRNYCDMVKKCYKEIINCIVDENANQDTCLEESVEIYKKCIERLDNYQIDFDDLILTAQLAKSYKTRPVHVILAEKLKERKEEVQVGDRLAYIFIESNDPKLSKSELGEDPEYAKLHNLKYNRGCYLTQLARPICGFFKVVLNKNLDLLHDVIDFTNEKCVKYKIDKLKEKDFIIDE